ncbi:hypothetical protein IEQ34_009831 [Dendrobium chrysotoxum]|uniref:C2H2-type domain-containing protein n=1 Tax=Dendrobium chrysotoxum TaxID=161865 RepID=A0AAV7GZL3_DENCH|nr:hypothetical protein IEQ34_009831 [Dendrobium chrysotoxum]
MTKRFGLISEEEEDMASSICTDSFNIANVLMLLSRGHGAAAGDTISPVAAVSGGGTPEGKVFECKTCSRKFTTFQALGGHRASHKKPRLGGPAAAPEKPKVHECSICGLEFAIGQALGGHMRRHRPATENGAGQLVGPSMEKSSTQIDLNLPPLERGEEEVVRQLPKLLGFTLTPAMVDCFH